ncbi:MAG: NAD(P)H-quinone oxidoreductase subunit F [Leptolyngbya sp. SIO4C5]|uniref:NAD(P)H-quinone oxidoreductase subunit F n=1 Tax=Sphaerothrix gracilis TaxID=3151835 RepID=UPI0013C1FF5C|nr:NAD(P)H-quinone oxidoreductase subunit F [Leptolyngbya sp. SIO4C5]
MTQFLIQTSWLVPIYGLLGAVLGLPWSIGLVRRTGPRPAAYINIFTTVLALLHGGAIFRGIWNEGTQELVFNWLQAADLNLSFAFEISILNVGFLELITVLSLLAQIYALGYLEKDWAIARFFSLMGFFEGAMSGIVLSSSLFVSYSLLEMLTLSTYMLVGFWYAQPLVVTAARDAFLTKRIGDVLLLMGVVSLAAFAGDLNFNHLYEWVKTADLSPLTATLLGLALIAGPTGKCAQFPLHLWLDEAMEGPNPASIMRNSVVVACGAYVLIKLQPIVILSPIALTALIAIGVTTAVGASLVAIAQIDMKRALSYSTSAYLGLVFIAVGTEWPGVALTILFTHAVAKALIFMSVGSVILTTNNQNLTELGGLGARMPATTFAYAVGSLGLTGFLPFGCFWGLRLGIDFLWQDYPWLVAVFLLVNALTALNLVRIFRLVFLGQPEAKTHCTPEVGWTMAVPMIVLAVFTLLLPVMMYKLLLLPPWRYINPTAIALLVASGAVGTLIGATISLKKIWSRPIQRPFRLLQDLLAYDFYTEKLYRFTVVLAVDTLARLSNWFDRYIVDGFVNLIGFASLFSGESLKYSISGQSQGYLLTIVIGVSLLGLLMTWSMW